MLGRMARRVQHVHDDIAERQAVAVVHRTDRESHLGPGMEDIFGTGLACEDAPGGTMIGVDMGIDDEADAHSGVVGNLQVWCDVADRIDDGTSGMPAAAEQVGDGNRIGMEELTHDHAGLPQAPSGALTAGVHSINLQIDFTNGE